MRNEDIKQTILKSGVKMWEVAEKLNISDSSFSRKLRYKLAKEEKDRIYEIIQKLRCEKYDE